MFYKFPFHLFKREKWDVEHIDSNTTNNLEDENSIFNHYKKLIKIRKNEDVVVYGDFKLLYKDHNSIFSYIRFLYKAMTLQNLENCK